MERPPNHGWRRLPTLLGILLICAATTSSNRSCSFGNSSNNGGDGGNDPTFVATLELQDSSGNVTNSFERNGTITMILTVRNRRDTTQTIDFTESRTRDFVVVRDKGGMCRIVGDAAGLPPLPRKSVVLVGRFDTWLEALAAMNGLHTQQQCRWVSPFAS